ncbi:MAG: 3'(2'),5'-bisphosphate nucleotidase [Chloroflexota bacterium]
MTTTRDGLNRHPFTNNLPEVQFALHAAQQATLLVRQVQAQLVSPALAKDDRSPVTVADFAAQALIGHLLADAFPQDALVAEEDSRALRQPEGATTLEQVTSFLARLAPKANPQAVCDWIDHGRVDTAQRFWVLDPIDGTKGFLRGDQYAVAFALVIDGLAQVGILGCPNLVGARQIDHTGPGSLVVAVRGQGAWTTELNQPGRFERLHVSEMIDPSSARLLRSFEAGHTNVDQIDHLAQALNIQAEPVRMDSQAKYALLAAGGGELMVRLLSADRPNYREKIWDQAAGSLVLEEAGGRITDLSGKDLDFTTGRSLTNNRGILASNGRLHPAALQALQAIGA